MKNPFLYAGSINELLEWNVAASPRVRERSTLGILLTFE